MSEETSAEDIASLRKELAEANEMALLALQTAIQAVTGAAVALRSLEDKSIAPAERAFLEKARNFLLEAEGRVLDWTNK